MKNAVLLLLAAGLLFGVSAGLSLWLNRPKATEEASAVAKSAARKEPHGAKPAEEKSDHPAERPAMTLPSSTDPVEIAGYAEQLRIERERLHRREQEMNQQRDAYRIVLDDVRDEMAVLQKLWQKRAAEAKASPVRPTEPPKTGTTAPPMIPPLPDPRTPKSPESLELNPKGGGLIESMPPENAAKLIEQLAKTGKLEMAVQMVAKMNPRQAAKILAAFTDEKLAVDIVERIALIRKPVSPAPAAGGPP